MKKLLIGLSLLAFSTSGFSYEHMQVTEVKLKLKGTEHFQWSVLYGKTLEEKTKKVAKIPAQLEKWFKGRCTH